MKICCSYRMFCCSGGATTTVGGDQNSVFKACPLKHTITYRFVGLKFIQLLSQLPFMILRIIVSMALTTAFEPKLRNMLAPTSESLTSFSSKSSISLAVEETVHIVLQDIQAVGAMPLKWFFISISTTVILRTRNLRHYQFERIHCMIFLFDFAIGEIH